MKTDHLIDLLARDSHTAARIDQAATGRAIAVAAAASGVVLVAFLALAGPRSGLFTGSTMAVVGLKLIVTLATVTAGLVLTRRLSQPVLLPARSWWLAPLVALAGLGLWETAMLGSTGWQARMTGANGLYCLTMIPLVSLLPLAALLATLRSRAPRDPALAGAAAGLAAAGIGASIYALHCTEDSALFLALWYTLAGMVVVALGAMTGRRLLAW